MKLEDFQKYIEEQLISIDREWDSLGFFQKIKRGREFQVRIDSLKEVIRIYYIRKKQEGL